MKDAKLIIFVSGTVKIFIEFTEPAENKVQIKPVFIVNAPKVHVKVRQKS